MPRVSKVIFDQQDFYRAREWLSVQSITFGKKLEYLPPCEALLNPESKVLYNVVLSPGRTNNALLVSLKADLTPYAGGEATAQWLAVVESPTSEVHLIPYQQFVKLVAYAVDNGGTYQGCRVEDAGSHKLVHLNLGWAVQQKIIHKTEVAGKDDESFEQWRAFAGATKEDFCHLHNHSMYSMLDGVCPPEDLVRAAVQNGQPGIALTDHGYMYGLYKFWKACKEYEVKSVLGCEIYLVDDVSKRYVDVRNNDRRFEYHLTLHAMNETGWRNLCTMQSIAGRDHYYYVPRVDRAMLAKYNEGIICLTGCFKGPGQFHLQQHKPEVTNDVPWYRYDPDLSMRWYQFLKQTFGDRCYGEVHVNDFPQYMEAVPRILQQQRDAGLKTVVAQDAHYSITEDAVLQRLLTKINSNRADDLGAAEDIRRPGCYFIRSRTEISHPLVTPDMFDRTCEVMERCTLSLKTEGYLFPAYDMQADLDWSAFTQRKE
jgi:hypothetical protein